jgi:hypothetical protein
MAYVGTPIDTRNTFQSLAGKRFNGDGSTTAFTLDVAPSSTLDIEVFVGNVRQDPNSAYTLSGTTLTFTGAPPSGTNNIYVVHQAKSVGTIDPPATETVAKTFSGATTISGALVASSTAQFDTVGIGAAKDLGTGLHIKTGDSGNGAETHADELVIENNTNGGLTLAMGNSNSATIAFANSNSNEDGKIVYRNTERELRFNTANAEKMRIDSAGHVTKPLNTYVYAYMNADQTVNADDNNHNLNLNAELKDLNADFNVSNYTFTAPVDGAYMCSAFINMIENTAANVTDWFFGFNASNGLDRGFGGNPSVYETGSGSNYTKTVTFSKIVYMDANDTMTLIADAYSGGSYTFKVDGSTGIYGATSLQIYLLG